MYNLRGMNVAIVDLNNILNEFIPLRGSFIIKVRDITKSFLVFDQYIMGSITVKPSRRKLGDLEKK